MEKESFRFASSRADFRANRFDKGLVRGSGSTAELRFSAMVQYWKFGEVPVLLRPISQENAGDIRGCEYRVKGKFAFFFFKYSKSARSRQNILEAFDYFHEIWTGGIRERKERDYT